MGGGEGGDSPMATWNLASVGQQTWPPRRWCLIVVVQRVEVVTGEITLVVSDPTGQAQATVDRCIPKKWPDATSEGSVLVLVDAVAVPPLSALGQRRTVTSGDTRRRPQLFITERCLANCVAASDVSPEEAAGFVAEV